MVPFMLIDAPDDRYRGGEPKPSWRRVLRLLMGAVACFLLGALLAPFGGYLLQVVAAALVLVAISMLD
jgi:hypothetical protein